MLSGEGQPIPAEEKLVLIPIDREEFMSQLESDLDALAMRAGSLLIFNAYSWWLNPRTNRRYYSLKRQIAELNDIKAEVIECEKIGLKPWFYSSDSGDQLFFQAQGRELTGFKKSNV